MPLFALPSHLPFFWCREGAHVFSQVRQSYLRIFWQRISFFWETASRGAKTRGILYKLEKLINTQHDFPELPDQNDLEELFRYEDDSDVIFTFIYWLHFFFSLNWPYLNSGPNFVSLQIICLCAYKNNMNNWRVLF